MPPADSIPAQPRGHRISTLLQVSTYFRCADEFDVSRHPYRGPSFNVAREGGDAKFADSHAREPSTVFTAGGPHSKFRELAMIEGALHASAPHGTPRSGPLVALPSAGDAGLAASLLGAEQRPLPPAVARRLPGAWSRLLKSHRVLPQTGLDGVRARSDIDFVQVPQHWTPRRNSHAIQPHRVHQGRAGGPDRAAQDVVEVNA